MYETDTGVGGGVFLSKSVFAIAASGFAAVPYGTFIAEPLPSGVNLQINDALQGASTNWVSVPTLNPIKSDGASVQLQNTNATSANVTLINFNPEA